MRREKRTKKGLSRGKQKGRGVRYTSMCGGGKGGRGKKGGRKRGKGRKEKKRGGAKKEKKPARDVFVWEKKETF